MAKRYLSLGAVSVILALIGWGALTRAQIPLNTSPAHLSSTNGVFRDQTLARGDCGQCHTAHEETDPNTKHLFADNNNYLCFSPDGVGGCHATRPSGASAGYPATALDRMPLGVYWQGYFEANNGGLEQHGVLEQVRWPGQLIWDDPTYSPHAYDPDMPRQDNMSRGSCMNCHNVHEGVTEYDLLLDSAGPLQASMSFPPPAALGLCLGCHSTAGPPGMNPTGRLINDFYDNVNKSQVSNPGHAFLTPNGNIQAGSKLPCYNCHNPHGSAGSNGLAPNNYLLSDERPGWYGLTDTKNDPAQVRRFCSGCHPFSDGVGGGLVEGVVLAPLTDLRAEHSSMAMEHCYDCHGRDYDAPNGRNVHNPNLGLGVRDE